MSGCGCGPTGIITSARVDIATGDNVTWSDAFEFDPPAATGCPPPPYPCGQTGPTWTFDGQNFQVDIKGSRNQTGPAQLQLYSLPSNSTLFVVDDSANRIMHMNVPPAVLTGLTGATGATGAGLIPGYYDYAFYMYDGSSPPVVVELMHGEFKLTHGV